MSKKNTHHHTHTHTHFLFFFESEYHHHRIILSIVTYLLFIVHPESLGLVLERSGRTSALVVSLDPVVTAPLPFHRRSRRGKHVGVSQRCVVCPALRSRFGFLDAFVRRFHVGVGVGGGGNRRVLFGRRVALMMAALRVGGRGFVEGGFFLVVVVADDWVTVVVGGGRSSILRLMIAGFTLNVFAELSPVKLG